MKYQSLFSTAIGTGMVIATEAGLCRIELPQSTQCFDRLHSSTLTRQASSLLERYFRGEQVAFDLALDLSGNSPFQQLILSLTALIPYGQLATYGWLAKQADRPCAARAVGRALAANPLPVIIPCHRIIAASGELTGYSCSGGILMKKNLLIMEGIDFRGQTVKVKNTCFAQEFLIKK